MEQITDQLTWKFHRFEKRTTKCDACGHALRNVFIIQEPGGGLAEVGVECLKHTLMQEELGKALREYRRATWMPSQKRVKTRLEVLQRKIPTQVLSVWAIEIRGHSVKVQILVQEMRTKIDDFIALADWEMETLTKLEALLR